MCEARADFPGGESSAADEGRLGLLAPGRDGAGTRSPQGAGSQPPVTTGRLFYWPRCPGLLTAPLLRPGRPFPGPIPWTSLLASRGASLGEGRKGEHVDTLPAGLWKLWL